VSSVTYNGISLTQISSVANGNTERAALFYLINPASGTHNIVVTLAVASRFIGGAYSYTGVNQATPLGTSASAIGNSSTSSVTISSATNELVVDVLARRGDLANNPITVGAGQTQRWNRVTTINNANNGEAGTGSSKTGQTSTLMAWSWINNRQWVAIGVSLKPAPPADTTPPLRSNALPNGTLPFGTTQTTMSLTTNENATCKYGANPNTAYASMPNTFTTTGASALGNFPTKL